jgi:hypothetical protein
MSEQVFSKEAQVGAKWWADQLRSGFTPNNGSVEEEGTIANLSQTDPAVRELFAMARVNDEAALTPEKVDAFEAALVANIEALLIEDEGPYHSTFGVDYHPDKILSDALATAEIEESMTTLPWKTDMWVLRGSVKVSAGYGAEYVELLS